MSALYLYPFDQPAFGAISVICMVVALILFIYATIQRESGANLKRAVIAACLGFVFVWSTVVILLNTYTKVAGTARIAASGYLPQNPIVWVLMLFISVSFLHLILTSFVKLKAEVPT